MKTRYVITIAVAGIGIVNLPIFLKLSDWAAFQLGWKIAIFLIPLLLLPDIISFVEYLGKRFKKSTKGKNLTIKRLPKKHK